MERRTAQAWTAFGANKRIAQIITKVFNQLVLPVFAYSMATTSSAESNGEIDA